MINSDDFEHITCFNLGKILPSRTIKSFEVEEDATLIRFTDGSVLTITWHKDGIGYELFEGPI